jgi:hypothetical protein
LRDDKLCASAKLCTARSRVWACFDRQRTRGERADAIPRQIVNFAGRSSRRPGDDDDSVGAVGFGAGGASGSAGRGGRTRCFAGGACTIPDFPYPRTVAFGIGAVDFSVVADVLSNNFAFIPDVIANLLSVVADFLSVIANLLTVIANLLTVIANLLTIVANLLAVIANVLAFLADVLSVVANFFSLIANIVAFVADGVSYVDEHVLVGGGSRRSARIVV